MIVTINALKVAEILAKADAQSSPEDVYQGDIDYYFEILTNANIDGWYLTEKMKPEPALEVLGYHEKWIDKEFKPDGICVCFMQDDKIWFMAKWCNDHDEWRTVECDTNYLTPNPTHWRAKPITPTQ